MNAKKKKESIIRMKPFVKWPGGKEKELKFFSDYFPNNINDYIEPFVGGGAVFFYSFDKKISGRRYINDFSTELIKLYTFIKNGNKDFYNELSSIAQNIDLMSKYAKKTVKYFINAFDIAASGNDYSAEIDRTIKKLYVGNSRLYSHLNSYDNVFEKEVKKALLIKIKKATKLAVDGKQLNVHSCCNLHETSLKMALYNTIRHAYNTISHNNACKIAYFLYLREFCYSSMFRYNADGNFNVPYGGMSYNNKNITKTIEYIKSPEMIKCLNNDTIIKNLDFEKFLTKLRIDNNDFIFCDPPYDTDFSEYEKNEFGRNDHIRLAEFLEKTNAKIMVVIKDTDFIRKLYEDKGFLIRTFDKKYNVNFQNRNKREVKHLIITNYETEGEE